MSIAKPSVAGAYTGFIVSQIVSVAVKNTPTKATNGVVLHAGLPYRKAMVIAIKPGGDSTSAPVANTGNVYISYNTGSGANIGTLVSCVTLAPGAAFPLPDNCDLNDFSVLAATAGDGVTVVGSY